MAKIVQLFPDRIYVTAIQGDGEELDLLACRDLMDAVEKGREATEVATYERKSVQGFRLKIEGAE